jgi:hypothetical protein
MQEADRGESLFEARMVKKVNETLSQKISRVWWYVPVIQLLGT